MAHGARRRQSGGASLGIALLIAAALAGGGAWNYRRNLAAEEAARAARPLSGYATEDLQALGQAYRSEVARLNRRYEGARASRSTAPERGFFGEQIDEYERVRRSSAARRAVGGDLSEAEASLRQVEQELAARGAESGAGLQVHLRRLLTF